MKFEKFEIGNVYVFDYIRETTPIYNEPHILVKLKEKECNKLINNIQKNVKTIKENFKKRQHILKNYFKLMDNLEKIKKERIDNNVKRKTDKEKQLENKIHELKKQFWPKRNYSQYQQALMTIMRNFHQDNIILNENGKIKALYVGESITVNGKINHKWYVLSPVKVPLLKANLYSDYLERVVLDN